MLVKYSQHIVPILLAVIYVGLMACDRVGPGAASVTNSADSGEITGASQFFLQKDVLPSEVERALDGDQAAADRVYMHYATVNPGDRETQLYWMRIAAENGSAGYMSLYARTLYEEGGHEQCRRALFWLKRSSELGPELMGDNETLRKKIEGDACLQRLEPDKRP